MPCPCDITHVTLLGDGVFGHSPRGETGGYAPWKKPRLFTSANEVDVLKNRLGDFFESTDIGALPPKADNRPGR
jgi:hypothetical protein